MSQRLAAVAVLLVAAALALWAGLVQSRWGDRCRDSGGTVEKRFEGIRTTHIGNGQYPSAHYSYHCWINGREVNP